MGQYRSESKTLYLAALKRLARAIRRLPRPHNRRLFWLFVEYLDKRHDWWDEMLGLKEDDE